MSKCLACVVHQTFREAFFKHCLSSYLYARIEMSFIPFWNSIRFPAFVVLPSVHRCSLQKYTANVSIHSLFMVDARHWHSILARNVSQTPLHTYNIVWRLLMLLLPKLDKTVPKMIEHSLEYNAKYLNNRRYRFASAIKWKVIWVYPRAMVYRMTERELFLKAIRKEQYETNGALFTSSSLFTPCLSGEEEASAASSD